MALEDIKKMTRSLSEEKQVASGPDPNDMSGWYEMYDDLKDKGELPDWMNSFEMFMENLDVLDISPMDFTRLKGKKEKRLAMSDPDPMEGYDDLLEKSALEVFGKPLKSLTNDEYEELEERIRDMDIDIPWAAKGGIVGLRNGGDPRIEQQPEGIMQLASHTGEDVIQSAIIWAAGLPQFGSVGSVLDALNNSDHPYAMDINGLVNAYMDARTESN